MTMNSDVKTAWVTALRSGEYQQGPGALKRVFGGDVGYCCLGVLCDIAQKELGLPGFEEYDESESGIPLWRFMFGDGIYDHTNSYAPFVVMEWAGIGMDDSDVLVEMNDTRGNNFNEIAAYIETNL